MATSRGREEVRRFIGGVPKAILPVLRGAGRAAADVVADEAKSRSVSSEVTAAIKVGTKVAEGQVIARVQVKGPGAYIAPWLEYGTDPHFISVDASQRGGMSIRRINARANEEGGGSLVIGGAFVGSTVWHPGARPHPFMRVSLDVKEAEAITAARNYIAARVGRNGIAAGDAGKDDL